MWTLLDCSLYISNCKQKANLQMLLVIMTL